MKLFILMGTHLAEIRQCLESLVQTGEPSNPIEIHIPEGLEWEPGEKDSTRLKPYGADSLPWVFDPDAEGTAFIVLDPRHEPMAQLEELADDLKKCLLEPVKIITCVDCKAIESHPHVKAYYDACIYYSDVVLLGNRKETAKSFARNFEKSYLKDCYPCLFLFLKGPGNPDHPLEILTPGTRRISQLFDLGEAEPEDPLPGMIIEASCDLDLEEEEFDPFRSPAEKSSGTAPLPDVSPWIVRAG